MKHTSVLALALAGATALSAPLHAEETPVFQGSYVIEAYFYDDEQGAAFEGCMIRTTAEDGVPRLFGWNQAGERCGAATPKLESKWDIYAVEHNGTRVHVIRSGYDQRCLIRGNSNQATVARLYRWNQSADVRYCGFASAAALIANGQATWDLSWSSPGSDYNGFVYQSGYIRQAKNPDAYLYFDPRPVTPPGFNNQSRPVIGAEQSAQYFVLRRWIND